MSRDYDYELKEYLKSRVIKCIEQNSVPNKYGYLLLLGGEALNFHLDDVKMKRVHTSDFDLKFVVNPEYTDDERKISMANIQRLKIATQLVCCLTNLVPPKDYLFVYPKLAIRVRDEYRLVYEEDNKLYYVDPFTGEEQFTFYQGNKIFTILLYYGVKGETQLRYFGLVDLGLFYRKESGFSYFEKDIYDTFLRQPFKSKNPIPFKTFGKIRVPTLHFLYMDNFRMTLISLDNLAVLSEDQTKVEFWNKKLVKYWDKHKMLHDLLLKYNSGEKMRKLDLAIKSTHKLYEPLSSQNMVCFREGIIYVPTMQKKSKCDSKYVAKLEDFERSYQNVLKMISELQQK